MEFLFHAIWRRWGRSAATRWLASAVIGAIGGFAFSFTNPLYSTSTASALGAACALLAYGPLEYFGHNRELTKEGGIKITVWDFCLMLVYFSVVICLVSWFSI